MGDLYFFIEKVMARVFRTRNNINKTKNLAPVLYKLNPRKSV